MEYSLLEREKIAPPLHAAAELLDLLKTSFGPTGGTKLIVSDDGYTVTDDLHRILDAVEVVDPSARLVAQAGVSQKEYVGDGSMEVVLLVGALSRKANELLEVGIDRTTIKRGYEMAGDVAIDVAEGRSRPVTGPTDPVVRSVAEAAFTHGANDVDRLLDVVIDAATVIHEHSCHRKGRELFDDLEFKVLPTDDVLRAELVKGVLLDREPVVEEMRLEVDNPRIAILGGGKKAGTGIQERRLKREGGSRGKGRTEVKLKAESLEEIKTFAESEANDVRMQVEVLSNAGVDVIFCTMGVSKTAIDTLVEAGITAYRNLTNKQARRLGRATGATLVMGVDNVSVEHLGSAGRLRTVRHDGNSIVRLEDCPSTHVMTVLISGSLSELTTELERDLGTAIVSTLDVLGGVGTHPGGGGIETAIAKGIRSRARGVPDRRSIVMEAFAESLEEIPKILAQNAGFDPVAVLADLRAYDGDDAGFNCHTGEVGSTVPDGPRATESVVRSVIETATQAAVFLVGIDDVLRAREPDSEAKQYNPQPDPERDAP